MFTFTLVYTFFLFILYVTYYSMLSDELKFMK